MTHVPLQRLLRDVGVRTRFRILFGLARRRGPVVLLGPGSPSVTSLAPLPGAIRFVPEISAAWPLWAVSEETSAARAALPLPQELKQRIDDWTGRWNRVMYDNFYEWPDDRLRQKFDREARALCAEIAEALGERHGTCSTGVSTHEDRTGPPQLAALWLLGLAALFRAGCDACPMRFRSASGRNASASASNFASFTQGMVPAGSMAHDRRAPPLTIGG